MKKIKELINDALYGIMIGSTIYLMTIMVGIRAIQPTPINLVGLFMMCAIIGITTELTNIEWWPYTLVIIFHFVVTAVVVGGFNFLFNWQWLNDENLVFSLVDFVVIYFIVWAGVIGYGWFTAQRINERLRARKKENAKHKHLD